MKKTSYLATGAGMIIFIALVIHQGVGTVVAAVSIAGLNLLWVALFRLIPLVLNTLGWRQLFNKTDPPPLLSVLSARWTADAFNTLLPVAQVGGHVIRAGQITRCGPSKTEAGATVVVDFTTGLVTQAIFALMGTYLLFRQRGDAEEIQGLVTGLIIAFFLLMGFYLTQRMGFFSFAARFIQSIAGRRQLIALAGSSQALDQNVGLIYDRRADILLCSSLRLLAWLTKTCESWLTLYFLGFPVTFQDAMIIESLSAAVASAAFIIPGALGIKEGGIMLIGSMLSVRPDIGLALAMVKRVCDLLVGIPGILTWMVAEGRRF